MVDANTIIKEAVNVGGDIVLTIIGENDNKEQIRKRLILDKKDFLVGGFDVYQEFKKMKNQEYLFENVCEKESAAHKVDFDIKKFPAVTKYVERIEEENDKHVHTIKDVYLAVEKRYV